MEDSKFEREILRNDCIYCDTCIAMSDGFGEFISKYGKLFRKHKKKMIIIDHVYRELLDKACDQKNKKARDSAYRAIELLNKNMDIFKIELEEKTVDSHFADPQFLIRLIENRPDKTQMFITKDGGLSMDAKNLNFLHSANGKPIKVCYINKYGNINRFHNCDVKENNVKYVEVEKIVEKPVIKVVKEEQSFYEKYGRPAVIGLVLGGGVVAVFKRKEIADFITGLVASNV